jgi:hypothetical protein
MEFSERFREGYPIANFETVFNMYLDEECATFEDAQRLFNECWTRRAMSERQRLSDAQAKMEKQQRAEQERVEAQQSAHIDSLRQQLRDARG